MEYKNTFLSEHYVYSCTSNLSLQFRNTSFDKLAFDRRERVGRSIRPRRDRDVSLPRPRRDRDVDNFRRDETETLVRLETVSRPRRRDRDHNPATNPTKA